MPLLHGGLKRLAKWGLCHAAALAGFDRLPRAERPVILMYHRVLPPLAAERCFSSPYIVTHADSFARQMDYLSARRRPMPLAELVGLMASGRLVPPKVVVVTFDDGWRDNHEHALPVLMRYGIPATIFLTADRMGTTHVFFPEVLRFLLSEGARQGLFATPRGRELARTVSDDLLPPEGTPRTEDVIRAAWDMADDARATFLDDLAELLDRPEMDVAGHSLMTWDQVREMARAGVEFGSHGLVHVRMTTLPDAALHAELTRSKARIEAETGRAITLLAYPKGDHDVRVRAAVRDAGYFGACSINENPLGSGTDLMALPRRNVCEPRFRGPSARFSPAIFQAFVTRLF